MVPTHLWGLPCDMDEIAALARLHGIFVIEDCAHALGATYRGRPIGTLGDAAFFSFQTIKPLNTYGGGMAVVRDPSLAHRVAECRTSAPLPDLKAIRQKLWQGRVQRVATRPKVFTWTMFPLVYACRRFNRSFDTYFWEKIRPLEPVARRAIWSATPMCRPQLASRASSISIAGTRKHAATPRVWTGCCAMYPACTSRRSVGTARTPSISTAPTSRIETPSSIGASGRRVDIETLHVDICTALAALCRVHTSRHLARRQMTQTIQIPIYESLLDEELERVGSVVKDAILSLRAVGTPAMRAS